MSDTTTGNSSRRCSFCGKTEEEAGGALVTLPPNTPVCPACLEREVNKMSQLFGFTMPGQGGNGGGGDNPPRTTTDAVVAPSTARRTASPAPVTRAGSTPSGMVRRTAVVSMLLLA